MLIVVALSSHSSQAMYADTNKSAHSIHSIRVEIDYAGYGDLDSDSYQDDILVVTTFYLASSAYYHYYYRISLILPSGTMYSYLVEVKAWVSQVRIYNFFIDHATEAGNYTVIVEAFLVYPDVLYTATGVIFDPPGGSNGGEPTFGAT